VMADRGPSGLAGALALLTVDLEATIDAA